MDIHNLHLSVKTVFLLKKIGIKTVEDLINCDSLDVLCARGFGHKKQREVRGALYSIGKSLKGEKLIVTYSSTRKQRKIPVKKVKKNIMKIYEYLKKIEKSID